METQFINQYNVTFEMCQEWANQPIGKSAIYNRKKGIFLRTTMASCSIIIIMLGLLLHEFFCVLFGSVFLIIALNRLFFLPNKIIKQQYNLILKSLNSNLWINKITFSDSIIHEAANSTHKYSYSEIIKMAEDRNYFFLFINEDMVLRIHKNGFIVGTVDEFREFCNSYILEQS
ncbi:YcxB family protein [Lacrimispora sp. BS-2]|uniref:YcxB family protein n=1 Tax=Lacrimispora sp. BS-2 TaxID=3151850 RepID=A0AAU7PJF2_9FIRM